MRFVVIGASTVVGSRVAAALLGAGHPTLELDSFESDGNRSEQYTRAFADADGVIDVSDGSPIGGSRARSEVKAAAEDIVLGATETGVRHVLLASSVGFGRPFASEHFEARLAAETLILASAVPCSIVRFAQLFESIGALAEQPGTGLGFPATRAPIEPIAAEDVAESIISIALGPPTNAVTTLAGPETLHIDELISRIRGPRDIQRAVASDRGATDLTNRAGHVAGTAHHTATRFDDWLRVTDPR